MTNEPTINADGDAVCEHGTAMDVHCCNCHSGFLFDWDACVCGSDDEIGTKREQLTAWAAEEDALAVAAMNNSNPHTSALHERRARCLRRVVDLLASAPSAPQPDEGLKAELARIDAVLARRPALDKPTRVENVEHAITTAGRMTDRVSRLEVERDIITRALPAWAHDTDDVPLSAQVRAAFVTMSAEIEKLKLDLANAKLAPIGDNHHNAAACPYCSPKLPSASQEEPTQANSTLIADMRLAMEGMTRMQALGWADLIRRGADALEALSSSPQPTERLIKAARAVTGSVSGAQRLKVEADPLYGIKEHERWYPKASLVDTDLIVDLSEALSSSQGSPTSCHECGGTGGTGKGGCVWCAGTGKLSSSQGSASEETRERPILAFQAWAVQWASIRGPMTQDQYFLAQEAFFAAHPGQGPQSSTMAAPSSSPEERLAPTPSERTDFWAVEVSRNGDSLVRIESNCLSGKPEFSDEDARIIRMAAEHLSAFIGPEEREPFIPCDHDYVWVQETVLNGTQYRCEICGHVKWEKAPAETQEEWCTNCARHVRPVQPEPTVEAEAQPLCPKCGIQVYTGRCYSCEPLDWRAEAEASSAPPKPDGCDDLCMIPAPAETQEEPWHAPKFPALKGETQPSPETPAKENA